MVELLTKIIIFWDQLVGVKNMKTVTINHAPHTCLLFGCRISSSLCGSKAPCPPIMGGDEDRVGC